jgi:hypothetical protein
MIKKESKIYRFLQKHHIWTSAAAFALLAIVFTYPLITNFSGEIPKGGRDSYLVMGQIEIRSEVVSSQGWVEGMKTIFKNGDFGSYLPYIVANQFFRNKFVTNNFLFLLSFVLSGLGAYLLALHFTQNKKASFLAGIVFAFSPFHVYQATAIHLGMRHQELIPFFVLFLMRFFEKFEFKFIAFAALFAILIAVTEHQLLAFTALFAAFFVLYKIISDRALLFNKRLWAFLFGSIFFLGAIALAFFGSLLKVALSPDNFLDPGMKSVTNLSIVPSDVLLPPTFQSLWPNVNKYLQESIFHTSSKGDSYYAGISVVVVVLFFLFWFLTEKMRGKKGDADEQKKNSYAKFWLIETAVFFVIAMGPASIQIGKWTTHLPYYLIYRYIPFYLNIRVVGRFFVFVALGLSVLIAFAAEKLTRKYSWKKCLIVTALGALILIDFWIAPMRTDRLLYSPFYDKIGKDTEPYKLLEIPGSTNDVFFNYEWITRSVHHKELVNGMPLAREIEGQFDFQENTPVIKQLLYTIPKGQNPEKKIGNPLEYYKSANLILNSNNIRYITISKEYTDQEDLLNEEKFIEKYIKFDNKYEDDFLIAYKVTNVLPNLSQ